MFYDKKKCWEVSDRSISSHLYEDVIRQYAIKKNDETDLTNCHNAVQRINSINK